MLIAGRAMAGALEVLRPLLADTGAETVGTFVMGTVKGDVHDIGKNLVNIMLEGAGFHVIDLGVQVSPEKFIAAVEEHKPDILGFSAFLTTTMPMFKANINALEKAGLRDQVIVMVGGAPVTQEYADAVGADGYAADASAAVKRAKELLGAAARDGRGLRVTASLGPAELLAGDGRRHHQRAGPAARRGRRGRAPPGRRARLGRRPQRHRPAAGARAHERAARRARWRCRPAHGRSCR